MMRKAFLLPVLMVLLASCGKNGVKPGKNCIQRNIIPVTAHEISASEVAEVDALFRKAGISFENFRYFKYRHDTLQTLYPPYATKDHKNVRVYQYINGLPIFNADMVFNFYNDTLLEGTGGQIAQGTSLDTIPHQNLKTIRDLFVSAIKNDPFSKNSLKGKCVSAEFGYKNNNADMVNAPMLLAKTWKVSPKGQETPVLFVDDSTGQVIYFWNGVME